MVLESAPAASNQSALGVRLMFRGKARGRVEPVTHSIFRSLR